MLMRYHLHLSIGHVQFRDVQGHSSDIVVNPHELFDELSPEEANMDAGAINDSDNDSNDDEDDEDEGKDTLDSELSDG
jgi:hypothetical protein